MGNKYHSTIDKPLGIAKSPETMSKVDKINNTLKKGGHL